MPLVAFRSLSFLYTGCRGGRSYTAKVQAKSRGIRGFCQIGSPFDACSLIWRKDCLSVLFLRGVARNLTGTIHINYN